MPRSNVQDLLARLAGFLEAAEPGGPVFRRSAMILLVIFGGLTDRSDLGCVERLKNEREECIQSTKTNIHINTSEWLPQYNTFLKNTWYHFNSGNNITICSWFQTSVFSKCTKVFFSFYILNHVSLLLYTMVSDWCPIADIPN